MFRLLNVKNVVINNARANKLFYIKKRKQTCIFSLHLVFIMFLLVLNFCSVSSASDENPFGVNMYCGWGGYYRPMEWTPMEITVSSTLENAFDGSLTLTTQQDGLNTMNITHDLVLTPKLQEYVPLVTKIAYMSKRCILKLDEKEGKTVWSNDYDLWGYSNLGNAMLSTVNEQDILIGVIGSGKFGLLRISTQTMSLLESNRGKVFIGTKQPEMVPWDWTGFVSLDLLVLYDPDWDKLHPNQLKAIAEWVSNGGKLLLVLGSNPPAGDNPLTNIIPFDFMETREIRLGSRNFITWQMDSSDLETIPARLIVPKSETKFYEGEIYQDNQYLFAVGKKDFGKIGVLSFDPADLSLNAADYSARFWSYFLGQVINDDTTNYSSLDQRKIQYVEDSGIIQDDSNRFRYVIGKAHALNNVVMSFLYQEIKPLSVWFVIILLALLAILLGPVDYKILKRLDRLPLTWITCSFWIIVFTIGAYFGVQALRGGKMQLKVVSVLDGIQNSNMAWSTHYSGFFAARSDSYKLNGLEKIQWWSGIAPTQDSINAYSSEAGSRKIYCVQEEGGNLPESIPVNIWDIQCMLTESPIKKVPFNASIKEEDDEIILSISNETDTPITNGYVLLEDNWGIEFGSIKANDIEDFRQSKHRIRKWEDIERKYSQNINYTNYSPDYFDNEAAFYAQGTLQRTRAIKDYIDNGAAVVCVFYEKAPTLVSIKNHSFDYEHIEMARLIVFPTIEGN